MAKDPAALIYIDKWVSATNGMKAEFRAWYFDLLLYQFDNGSLPNDEDELAGICRVRPSEFTRFNQMVNQVVNQKFNQMDDGRLQNDFAKEVIEKRKTYKKGKIRSSAMGVIIRYALNIENITEAKIDKLKKYLYQLDTDSIIELKDKKRLNHLVNQMDDLLTIEDEDVDIIKNKDKGRKSSTKKFKPPTIEEVKSYCQERKNNINPENFVDFYTGKNWMIGKNKMKDWKACVRTWERNSNNQTQSSTADDNR